PLGLGTCRAARGPLPTLPRKRGRGSVWLGHGLKPPANDRNIGYSCTLPSGISAPESFAPSRLAPVRMARVRRESVRSAPARLARTSRTCPILLPVRSAPEKSAALASDS